MYLSEDEHRRHLDTIQDKMYSYTGGCFITKQVAVKFKQLQSQESYSLTPHDETNINQLTKSQRACIPWQRQHVGSFAGELVVMTHQQNIWPNAIPNYTLIATRF